MRPVTASPSKEFLRRGLALLILVSGAAWLRARFLMRNKPLVRALLIHHVKDQKRFAAMIRVIAKRYNPISLKEFREQSFDSSRVNILLTLDDGYESWYQNALPVLEQYNVPALCFVSSGFVRTSGDERAVAAFCAERLLLPWVPQPLKLESLRALAQHPLITIGGHTCTHPSLAEVPDEDLDAEISEDREVLRGWCNKDLAAFAYPFGVYTRESARAAERAGYMFAMTTREGFYTPGSDPYTIPRSNHGTVHPWLLRLWIWGAFDIVNAISRSLRRGSY